MRTPRLNGFPLIRPRIRSSREKNRKRFTIALSKRRGGLLGRSDGLRVGLPVMPVDRFDKLVRGCGDWFDVAVEDEAKFGRGVPVVRVSHRENERPLPQAKRQDEVLAGDTLR